MATSRLRSSSSGARPALPVLYSPTSWFLRLRVYLLSRWITCSGRLLLVTPPSGSLTPPSLIMVKLPRSSPPIRPVLVLAIKRMLLKSRARSDSFTIHFTVRQMYRRDSCNTSVVMAMNMGGLSLGASRCLLPTFLFCVFCCVDRLLSACSCAVASDIL
jgi:hypothetical protein